MNRVWSEDQHDLVAQATAETGIEAWVIEDDTPRTVILDYQWGNIETNIMVRRLSAAQFHVVFLTRDELRSIAKEKQ